MSASSKSNKMLNILFVLLTAILVVMITLHVRHLRNAGRSEKTPTAAVAIKYAREASEGASQNREQIRVTANNQADIEKRNQSARPPLVPDNLETPAAIKQALKRQTSTLLQETLDQPAVASEERRALALTKEEVFQLEREGRMAY